MFLLLYACVSSMPGPEISISNLLDNDFSYIAEPPYDIFSGLTCFRAESNYNFLLYDQNTTWFYTWEKTDINQYSIYEDEKQFFSLDVLDYKEPVYYLKLHQGILSAKVYTTDCDYQILSED